MHSTDRRRLLLRGSAFCLAAAWLPRAGACEFFSVNLRILHPWVHASVPGETHALLHMTFDEVARADRLVGVSTPVATGAELADRAGTGVLDLPIPAARTTVLGETAPLVRLTGLAHPLELGRTYPLRLHFAEAGTVGASLSVDTNRFF